MISPAVTSATFTEKKTGASRTDLDAEFDKLPNSVIPEPKSDPANRFSIGITKENISRNRYLDIVANDATGVRTEWGYINANYCMGRKVIVAQGPLNDGDKGYDWHHRDFYDMIWRNNTTAIAMLTPYVEDGVRKCSVYLPNRWQEHVYYGKEKKAGEYTINLGITVSKVIIEKGQERREVKHYHYTKWNDNQGGSAIAVAKLARILSNGHIMPVIHCSAGIGRSGTLAAVMYAYLQKIPVKDAVITLREERHGCVQNRDQYATAHKALEILLEEDLANQG